MITIITITMTTTNGRPSLIITTIRRPNSDKTALTQTFVWLAIVMMVVMCGGIRVGVLVEVMATPPHRDCLKMPERADPTCRVPLCNILGRREGGHTQNVIIFILPFSPEEFCHVCQSMLELAIPASIHPKKTQQ